MQEIIAFLEGLAIGAPQVYRNIALFPLLATTENLSWLVRRAARATLRCSRF